MMKASGSYFLSFSILYASTSLKKQTMSVPKHSIDFIMFYSVAQEPRHLKTHFNSKQGRKLTKKYHNCRLLFLVSRKLQDCPEIGEFSLKKLDDLKVCIFCFLYN